MRHTKYTPNSRQAAMAEKSTPTELEVRLAALQRKYQELEDECRALREECRDLRMQERNQIWKTNWRY